MSAIYDVYLALYIALKHHAPSNSEAKGLLSKIRSVQLVLLTLFLSVILPKLSNSFQATTVGVTVVLPLVSGTMATNITQLNLAMSLFKLLVPFVIQACTQLYSSLTRVFSVLLLKLVTYTVV